MTDFRVGITDLADAFLDDTWEKWALERRMPTILITKNFPGLIEKYPNITNNQNILIHATVTGYGGHPVFEPNVPKVNDILNVLRDFHNKNRIVIRIDPIIPLPDCIARSEAVFKKVREFGYKRIRVSVLDLYPHVLRRISKASLDLEWQLRQVYDWDSSHSGRDHQPFMVHAPWQIRSTILNKFVDAEICGEPGFKCDGCVSRVDLQAFGIKPEARLIKSDQREFCNCISNKKELLATDPDCKHRCVYCYLLRPDDRANIL